MIGVDYQLVFQSAPGLFLVLRPDTDFTIEGASDAYLRATLTRRDRIVGRALFDVFPGDPDDDRGRTIENLRESLLRVMATGRADALPVQRYDLSVPDSEDGERVERYWSPVNSPVLGPDGKVAYLIHRVEDVTELHRVTRLEQEERAKLVEANNYFQAIYDQGLFAGRLDLQGKVIDANRSSLEACGLVREDVLGKPLWECAWWNRSQAVQAWVRRAVDQAIGGQPFRGESPYFWADGSEHVVDFACMPIKDAAGNVLFIVPTGMDITDRVNAEKDLRPGQGSEFTVRLLLAEVQSRDTVVTYPVESALPRKRILVVDDNRDAAESLSMILMHLGADVRVAQDGPEALETFHDYDPSVVLLDIGMPGMDGYEVARTIRDRFPDRQTAIVALTGWGQDSDRQAAQDAGFDHHLVKPAEIGALQVLLRSLDQRSLASGSS